MSPIKVTSEQTHTLSKVKNFENDERVIEIVKCFSEMLRQV